jgi:DNA uptake protein ComE-like DNA-binding protein
VPMKNAMASARSPQNVRIAARTRVAEDWLPTGLRVTSPTGASHVEIVQESEAVPTDAPAAAELGSEVQRLRRDLRQTEQRAERAEVELATAQERAEEMKRAAANAAAAANPDHPGDSFNGTLDLNRASFEQLRVAGLSVTQAARLIGQREQLGGFESVDDVDAVVGLPRDLKQALKDHGSV